MLLRPKFQWDSLLDAIEQRRVIPVIGKEVLELPGPPRELFYARVARKVAEALGLEGAWSDIDAVAAAYLRECPKDRDGLHSSLVTALREASAVVPEPLRKLAQIRGMRLFLSTTLDDLLPRALAEAGRSADVQAFLRNGDEEANDLHLDAESDAATVYHLFGRASLGPDASGGRAGLFSENALTLTDALEYVHDLDAKVPALHAYLRDKIVLVLGCGFPDWLMGFFVRALRGEPFDQNERGVILRVADEKAAGPVLLVLEQCDARIYPKGPIAFIDELQAQLERRTTAAAALRPNAAAARPLRSAPLLLAAFPENMDIARALAAELSPYGLSADVTEIGTSGRAPLESASGCVTLLSSAQVEDPRRTASGGPLHAYWEAVEKRVARKEEPFVTALLALDDGAARWAGKSIPGWPDWHTHARQIRSGQGRTERLLLWLLGACPPAAQPSLYVVAEDEDCPAFVEMLQRQLKMVHKALGSQTEPPHLVHGKSILAGSVTEEAQKALIETAAGIVIAVSPAQGEDEAQRRVEQACSIGEARGIPIVPVRYRAVPLASTLASQRPFPPQDDPALRDRPESERDTAWKNAAYAVLVRVLAGRFTAPAERAAV